MFLTLEKHPRPYTTILRESKKLARTAQLLCEQQSCVAISFYFFKANVFGRGITYRDERSQPWPRPGILQVMKTVGSRQCADGRKFSLLHTAHCLLPTVPGFCLQQVFPSDILSAHKSSIAFAGIDSGINKALLGLIPIPKPFPMRSREDKRQ